jgi:LCP family protein required for cell wall assembly
MTVTTPRRPPSPDRDIVPSPEPAAPAVFRSRSRKDPLWARLTLLFGAVLMVVSGGGIVGSKVLIGNATEAITTDDLLGDSAKSKAEGGNSLDGPIDLLMLGVDARAGWAADDTRSDTIIILHINAAHTQASLISIPRDTELTVPAFPKSKYPGGTSKATEVFFHGAQNGAGWAGGAQLMARTLKDTTGISFDGAAIIDFGGFKGVIEALGGVRMCVDQQVKSIHMYMVDGKPIYKTQAMKLPRGAKPVVHKKGCRDMAGWEALDFARQRYGLKNGDYDRQRHQQQLIKAMAKKAADGGVLTNYSKVKALMDAAGKAFVLDVGDKPVADFLFSMKGVAANDLTLLRTNNGTFAGNGAGRETLTPESQAMFEAVKQDKLDEFILDHPTVVARDK